MADDKIITINKRLDALEVEEKEPPIEQLTLYVTYEQSFFNGGERCSRTVPAKYDESVPFPPARWNSEKGRWTTQRVLYPIGDDHSPHPYAEHQTSNAPDADGPSVPKTLSTDHPGEPDADHSIVRDPEVTGD